MAMYVHPGRNYISASGPMLDITFDTAYVLLRRWFVDDELGRVPFVS